MQDSNAILLYLLIRHSLFTQTSNERDIVTFQKNSTQLLPCLFLYLDFFNVIEDDIHVLVKASYDTFKPGLWPLVEPHLNSHSVTQEPVYHIDGWRTKLRTGSSWRG